MNEKEIDKIIDKVIKRNNDQNAVIIEDMQSNFKMFGEVLSGVNDKVNVIDDRLGSLEDRVGSLEDKVDVMNDKLDVNFEEIGRLKVEKVDIRLKGVETQVA